MSALPVPRLTPEQYLAIERAADFKSEYYDGQMVAMSGGSLTQSVIPPRLVAVATALRGRGCEIADSDLRVRIGPQGPFVYPDLTVYCGEPILADDYRDMLLNPTVVFEVLSKSSEALDRGYKFGQYRKIESLHEYVLVSQTSPSIEVFRRQPEGTWVLTEFTGMDAVCRLASLDCEFPLADIYRNLKLEP